MSAKRHSLILRLLLLPFLLLRPAEGSSLDLIPVSILCDSDYSITGKRESDQKDVAGLSALSETVGDSNLKSKGVCRQGIF